MRCSWLEWLHRARSRPVVPWLIRNWALVDAFGVSDREAEQLLAPTATARLLYHRMTIAGMAKLDML